jgi:hypothetical protein
MSRVITRRGLLSGAGHAAAFGILAAALPRQAAAQDADESAILLSLLYPNPKDAKFDSDYYRDKVIPLLRALYGDSIERIELCETRAVEIPKTKSFAAEKSHSPSEPAPRMGPPRSVVRAATRIWIRDVKAFGARGAASPGQMEVDLKPLTDMTPTVQFEKVVDVRGDARSAIGVGGQVSSTWFPAEEGKTFDAKYYDEKIIPLMVQSYGTDAIRRIEFSMGTVQAGNPPSLTAAAHYYIRDRAAWNAAGMKAGMRLMAEGPKYTTIKPVVADMEVSAVG